MYIHLYIRIYVYTDEQQKLVGNGTMCMWSCLCAHAYMCACIQMCLWKCVSNHFLSTFISTSAVCRNRCNMAAVRRLPTLPFCFQATDSPATRAKKCCTFKRQQIMQLGHACRKHPSKQKLAQSACTLHAHCYTNTHAIMQVRAHRNKIQLGASLSSLCYKNANTQRLLPQLSHSVRT